MKKSIIYFMFLIAVCAFSTNIGFAQSTVLPIAGTEVGLEHDPSDIIIAHTTTDQNGKFSFKLPVGKSKITLLYDQIKRAVSSIDKSNASNKDAYLFTLSFDEKSLELLASCKEKSMRKPFLITPESGTVTPHFDVTNKGGGTINGTLNFVKVSEPKR
jgi:hypothetical protein